jgi:outer membrane immunogenic protein
MEPIAMEPIGKAAYMRYSIAVVTGSLTLMLCLGLANHAAAQALGKDPVVPSAPAQPTGVSIGVTGGGGTGTSSQTDAGIGCSITNTCAVPDLRNADGSFRTSGGLVGVEITYNFTHYGPWVFGLAGDLSWADISGSSSSCGGVFSHVCGTTLQSFDTIRGNIGYVLNPFWMIYASGGYAGGNVYAWDTLAGG